MFTAFKWGRHLGGRPLVTWSNSIVAFATKANRLINYFPAARAEPQRLIDTNPTSANVFVIHHWGIHFPRKRQTILGQPTRSASHSHRGRFRLNPPCYWFPFEKWVFLTVKNLLRHAEHICVLRHVWQTHWCCCIKTWTLRGCFSNEIQLWVIQFLNVVFLKGKGTKGVT